MLKVIISFFILWTMSQPASALVDYSDERPAFRPKTRKIIKHAPPRPGPAKSYDSSTQSRGRVSSQGRPSGIFDIHLLTNVQTVQTNQIDGKVTFYDLQGHFQTPYNIFMDFRYWLGKTDQELISGSSANQNGNGTAIIGFNWLKFGAPQDSTMVDLYAGGVFKSSGSELGSSRTDKIFGVETTKDFYTFMLGLGYEYRVTGVPDSQSEADIGNISKITVAFGWRVSSDIHFGVESAMLNIAQGEGEKEGQFIANKGTYSYLTAKLGLNISPMVQLQLGGNFRTKKLKNSETFIAARLWDMQAAYGNSIFAGLNLSL